MATIIEQYVESIAELPSQLQRNFSLMQELDTKSTNLQNEIEEAVAGHLEHLRGCGGGGGNKRSRNAELEKVLQETKIEPNTKQCLQIADEKVQLAVQTYDLVDSHIRRLDEDLRRAEEDLRQGGESKLKKGNEDADDGVHAGGSTRLGALKREKGLQGEVKRRKMGAGPGRPPGGASQEGVPGVVNNDLDLPIDPNEPTYCMCNRVSFGEMIACDNPECKNCLQKLEIRNML
ncbi:hypothetical protein CYMTET_51869 [Cymbomonas tetramitiformis]|uniref:Inhibitor of growth protein N-terminal histone-binding domain-containing protein n=1 Tax=Cymbomonas tetramitiformis TaxID=36881 RepID=A0AAE0BLF9_9CHLO|nr:hypothetical protein CYMTET_51869 [Cymbomonas tetramitiformis]